MRNFQIWLVGLAWLSAGMLVGAVEHPWVSLFNGKNRDGWTPKVAGHPSGENFANTFRVVDGMIQVSYDDYGKFDKQYGHLFTNIAYSRYILRASSAPTFPAEEWVKIEVEVHGNEEVIHRVNGVEVLRYQRPQLDPRDDNAPASPLLAAGAALQLSYGHIALQAEGQPVWFRNIELKSLESQ